MGYIPDKPATIYAVRCRNTGRVYIGCTINLRGRITNHFTELRLRQKRCLERNSSGEPCGGVTVSGSIWQKDYEKYGRKSFDVYVLEENVPKSKRVEREDYWIRKYKSFDPNYGYNVRGETPREVEIVPGLPPLPNQPEEKPD